MTDLRTPSEWEKEFNIKIMDPDGWDRRNFAEDWARPITRDDFRLRAAMSTQHSVKVLDDGQ